MLLAVLGRTCNVIFAQPLRVRQTIRIIGIFPYVDLNNHRIRRGKMFWHKHQAPDDAGKGAVVYEARDTGSMTRKTKTTSIAGGFIF